MKLADSISLNRRFRRFSLLLYFLASGSFSFFVVFPNIRQSPRPFQNFHLFPSKGAESAYLFLDLFFGFPGNEIGYDTC